MEMFDLQVWIFFLPALPVEPSIPIFLKVAMTELRVSADGISRPSTGEDL
jgi:hypothetical protein